MGMEGAIEMAKRGPKPNKQTIVPLHQDFSAASRGLSSAARSAFKHVVDLLTQRGSLETTDVELVVAYAQTIEIRDVAYQQLQKDGAFVESDRGNIAAHPAEKIHAAACLRLKILAAEMALTPSSAKSSSGSQPGLKGYGQWASYLGKKTS
jgi:P27 family predicted phage terminase small subunit